MNALDDLRRTLDAHAAEADTAGGGDLGTRTASVHRRVHRVKRRRRAAVAGAAAAVVAVVGGIALLPGGADRAGIAPASVVGVDVPETMQSLGYGYRLVDTVEGDGDTVRVRLPASDQPRLVSWATSGDAEGVRVAVLGVDYRTSVPDFGDRAYVAAGAAAVVRVTADEGTPGLAVYQPDPDVALPAGVTERGVTFRQEVEGKQLLATSFGEPGQAEVSIDSVAVNSRVDLVAVCFGGDADTVLRTRDYSTLVRCGGSAPFDAGTMTRLTIALRPGSAVRETYTAVERGTREPAQDDDVVVALAVYGYQPPGVELPETTEDYGRSWQLVDVVTRSGDRIDAAAPDGDRASLAVVDIDWKGTATTEIDFGQGGVQRSASPNLHGVGGSRIVSPGQQVSARMSRGDTGVLRIGFYEPID